MAGLVAGSASGTTGIGNLLTSVGGSPNACWSISKVTAVGAPNRTFAHEIGHNMGASHAQDQGGSAGAEPAAFGWRFTGSDGKSYRTLLSYQKNPGEDRIPYYSNPAVKYQGTATGTATANNAGTLTKTAPKVAGYK